MKDETIALLKRLEANEAQRLADIWNFNAPKGVFADAIIVDLFEIMQKCYKQGIECAKERDLIITNSEKTFMKR